MNGTTVSFGIAGNTGGTSGDYFDTGNTSGGLAFDSTQKAHGSLSYKATSQPAFLERNRIGSLSDGYLRAYGRVDSLPSATRNVISGNGGGSTQWIIRLDSTGHVVITDGSLTVRARDTMAITANTWFRLEAHHNSSAQLVVRLYTSMDSTATTETIMVLRQHGSQHRHDPLPGPGVRRRDHLVRRHGDRRQGLARPLPARPGPAAGHHGRPGGDRHGSRPDADRDRASGAGDGDRPGYGSAVGVVPAVTATRMPRSQRQVAVVSYRRYRCWSPGWSAPVLWWPGADAAGAIRGLAGWYGQRRGRCRSCGPICWPLVGVGSGVGIAPTVIAPSPGLVAAPVGTGTAVGVTPVVKQTILAPVGTGSTGGATYAQVVLADTPVGYWKLDDPSGDQRPSTPHPSRRTGRT